MSHTGIYIEDYSAKSFVVRGETRDYKDALKSMGGKWNSRLTDKTTGDKFGAWLFWSDKRAELDTWIASGCNASEDSQTTNISDLKPNNNKVVKHASLTRGNTEVFSSEVIRRLESKIDKLTKMVEMLSRENKTTDKTTVETNVESDDEIEEEVAPRKRLLGGK